MTIDTKAECSCKLFVKFDFNSGHYTWNKQSPSNLKRDLFLSPDECPSGTELKPDGSCKNCEVGTYRKQGVDSVCTQCSGDRTTPQAGGEGADACSLGECVHY